MLLPAPLLPAAGTAWRPTWEKKGEPRKTGLQGEEEGKGQGRLREMAGWEQMDPGSWVCACQRNENTGLPESRRQLGCRSVFVTKGHIAGCSAERKREQKSTCLSHMSVLYSH